MEGLQCDIPEMDSMKLGRPEEMFGTGESLLFPAADGLGRIADMEHRELLNVWIEQCYKEGAVGWVLGSMIGHKEAAG